MKRILMASMVFALLAVMILSTGAFAYTPNASLAKGTPAPTLSAQEALDLQFMREEEKLARDVYVVMYQKWGMAIFNNISASEQQHMDAIATLLVRYQVADPAAGKGTGEFTNPDLQALYNDLVARGSQSKVEAMNVGVVIEEKDICDLEERLGRTTRSDIRQVYQNLMSASQNHLNAFNTALQGLAQ
jgi:hypothetical protein